LIPEARKRQRGFPRTKQGNVSSGSPVVEVVSSWEDMLRLLEQDYEVSLELEDNKFVLVSRGTKREDV